ncbi:MAG TPA: Pvc16 family protein, partial [Symbiobacteriaceae bacterium]|nr:Pvc16 family protein [Symbiobacteriaceae bacterium]
MATFQAIAAVCEGVAQLLRSNFTPADFDGQELEFKVYTAQDFHTPMQAGVSVFLYRILPSGAHRTPAGRLGQDGRRLRSNLPLELHFLLTAWAPQASLQNSIAGWMMRVLEDSPTLTASLLNATFTGVFR